MVLQLLVYVRSKELGNLRAHAVLKYKVVRSALPEEHSQLLTLEGTVPLPC